MLILTVPTVFMIPMNHAPLTAAWHVRLVAQLSLEDEFGLVFGHLGRPLGVVHPLLAEVSQCHLLLHNLIIMLLESTLLCYPHFAVRVCLIYTVLQANLKVRNGRFASDPSPQLI